MIDTYKVKTKFGKTINLALERQSARTSWRRNGLYVSLDGKMWDIDEDRSVYLVGSYNHWTKAKGWERRDRRTFFEDQHRVYMGQLARERCYEP